MGGRPLFFLGGSAGAGASPSPSPLSASAGASATGLFFGGLPRLRFGFGSEGASSSAGLYKVQVGDRVRVTAIERYSDNEPCVDALSVASQEDRTMRPLLSCWQLPLLQRESSCSWSPVDGLVHA